MIMLHKLVTLIRELGLEQHTLIESQDLYLLLAVKALNPNQKVIYWRDDIHTLPDTFIDILRKVEIDAIDVHRKGATVIHKQQRFRYGDFWLETWTINNADEIRDLSKTFNLIITDMDVLHRKPLDRFQFFESRAKHVKILSNGSEPEVYALIQDGYDLIEHGRPTILAKMTSQSR